MTRYAPLYQQADAYTATLDRSLIGAIWPTGGLFGGAVTVVTGTMNVNVGAGQAAVPMQSGQGSALCWWDAAEIVGPLAAAPPAGQSRIDIIVCQVRDNALDSGGHNDFLFTAVTGTAAASNPAVPATPTNAYALAQVMVPGNVSILDTATVTMAASPLRPAGPTGPTGPAGPMGTVTSVVAGRAYRNAAFTSSAGWTTIPMDTFSGLGAYDNGGNFNHGTGAYVCLQTGYYAVYGEMTYNMPSGAPLLAGIYQNGALATIGSADLAPPTAQQLFECVSDVLHCNAGDTLILASYTGAAAPIVINAGQSNYLSVTLLSAGPAGPTGPAGATGATGPAGPAGGAVLGMTVNSTYTSTNITSTPYLATPLAVTFIAPASGQVTVRMAVTVKCTYLSVNGYGIVTAQMYSAGSAIGVQQMMAYQTNSASILLLRNTFEQLFTGLTPGQSYTFTPYFLGGNGNTAYVMWGNQGSNQFGPAEVRVFAA